MLVVDNGLSKMYLPRSSVLYMEIMEEQNVLPNGEISEKKAVMILINGFMANILIKNTIHEQELINWMQDKDRL